MNLHVLLRKLRTFSTTVSRCSNWPALSLARLGITGGRTSVILRRGVRIEPLFPLSKTWGEIFEPAIADLYDVERAGADVIVDIGANIGAFTCLAAQSHPSAIVHAFEPSEPHAAQLERNLKLNGLTNVTLHRFAVTGDGRSITFGVNAEGGSSGIILPGEREITLPSITLDVIAFAGVGSALIKLDCEGAEGEIVEWIVRHRANLPARLRIACEYHHWCPLSLADLASILRGAGFSVTTPVHFDEQYLFAESV